MRKLLALSICLATITLLRATPLIHESEEPVLVNKPFNCTVTVSLEFNLEREDCNGQMIHITTIGTATSTAKTCELAYISASMSADYAARAEADRQYYFITADCQGPPQS